MEKRYTEYVDALTPLELMVSYEDGDLVEKIDYIYEHQDNTEKEGSYLIWLYGLKAIKLEYKVGPFTVEYYDVDGKPYINEEPKEEQLLEFTRTELKGHPCMKGYIITEDFSY